MRFYTSAERGPCPQLSPSLCCGPSLNEIKRLTAEGNVKYFQFLIDSAWSLNQGNPKLDRRD